MGRPPKSQSETSTAKPASAAPAKKTPASPVKKTVAASKLTAVKPLAPAPAPAKLTFFQRVKKFLHLK